MAMENQMDYSDYPPGSSRAENVVFRSDPCRSHVDAHQSCPPMVYHDPMDPASMELGNWETPRSTWNHPSCGFSPESVGAQFISIKPGPRLPLTRSVVKEGWLMKRGEHVKNWRRRYFKLREDGTFHGYRSKPKDDMAQPLNNFTVRDCQIIVLNKPKPYSFMLRGLQWSAEVERIFFVESEQDRYEWIQAIQLVADRLKPISSGPTPVLQVQLEDQYEITVANSPVKRYSVQDFELIKTLGKGTFGKVVLCREKETGKFYAMKILKKMVLIEKEELGHTKTENRVLQQCWHPFMTQLKYSFTTPNHLCFVMEYVCGGELYYHLSRERIFSEARTMFYAAEITSALGYLHDQNVVYRDLKLENLLLDFEGHVKITDFGLCKEDMYYGALTKTFCGTPEYLAPELLLDNDYTRAVDWWGLGVVSYEMMAGKLPFYSPRHEVLFEMILQEDIHLPRHLSSNAMDFLSRLLIKRPSKRLGGGIRDALEVMEHPFFQTIDWDKLVRKEIQPPWKPDLENQYDTKYIPEEFAREPVSITPPDSSQELNRQLLDGAYFKRFSFHGSRQSLGSLISSTSVYPDSLATLPVHQEGTVTTSNTTTECGTTSTTLSNSNANNTMPLQQVSPDVEAGL